MTMPKLKRRKRRPYVEGADTLCPELEASLLRWVGVIGCSSELHTVDDWRYHWAKWAHVILPKSLEHCPGTRPAACYVLGLHRLPTMRWTLPFEHPAQSAKALVGGEWFRFPGEPFQRCPTHTLFDEGVIDHAELRRWRAWRANGFKDTYPLEIAEFE